MADSFVTRTVRFERELATWNETPLTVAYKSTISRKHPAGVQNVQDNQCRQQLAREHRSAKER
jgi:hypothetical protein